jgi:hypothetical protein
MLYSKQFTTLALTAHLPMMSNLGNAVRWHIASFRCTVEFGGHRGAADIDQAAPINLDYEYAPVTFALARQPKNRRQKDAIVPYCG